MKAISSFISAVLVLAFTVATGSILILYFPSLIRTQTASTETYIQRARSCAGGDFNIYYTKVCKSNLKKGLVLWLKLDEGSGNIAEDYSGNGNDGTLYTGGEGPNTKWVDGKLGKALEFDGNDDYVNIPLELGNGSITFWFKSPVEINTSSSNPMRILMSGRNQIRFNCMPYYSCNSNHYGHLYFSISPAALQYSVLESIRTTWEANQWYYIVVTSNGTYQALYVNSVLDNSRTQAYVGGWGSSFYIGDPSESFNGTIDEVRIYNRVLSEDEIKALYYEGLTNKFNVTFYMLNKGIADLGKNFTCLLILDNGSSLTKKFSLSNSFGINNPYAQVSLNFDGYYPNYGLIDKIKVCSVECIDMCAEIKKEIEC